MLIVANSRYTTVFDHNLLNFLLLLLRVRLNKSRKKPWTSISSSLFLRQWVCGSHRFRRTSSWLILNAHSINIHTTTSLDQGQRKNITQVLFTYMSPCKKPLLWEKTFPPSRKLDRARHGKNKKEKNNGVYLHTNKPANSITTIIQEGNKQNKNALPVIPKNREGKRTTVSHHHRYHHPIPNRTEEKLNLFFLSSAGLHACHASRCVYTRFIWYFPPHKPGVHTPYKPGVYTPHKSGVRTYTSAVYTPRSRKHAVQAHGETQGRNRFFWWTFSWVCLSLFRLMTTRKYYPARTTSYIYTHTTRESWMKHRFSSPPGFTRSHTSLDPS